ncbi:MAG: C10 family peptidase [Muribaculaceae bacterium]|nr:C10 family peptidase [Muribaculaceae bacterium]
MNYFKLTTLLLAGLVSLGISTIDARTLSPDEVLSYIALSQKRVNTQNQQSAVFNLVYTQMTEDGMAPMMYIFNRAKVESSFYSESLEKADGFIVAASDDRFPILLGYSDNGTFDADNVPPQFQWWIDEYCRQMEWALSNYTTHTPKKAPHTAYDESWEPVDPIIKTQWNQSAPYSNLCPNQYSTGCVATAAAQVVRKWEWPKDYGTATHSYKWGSQILEFDYSSTRFDWDNMLDNYENNSYSEQEAFAVAQLMYAMGVGVDMAYSSGGSGAPSYRLPNLLINYLGYDKGLSFRIREYFSDAQWHKLIYDEVSAGRPVLYGGQSRSVGHEFICDGYSGDGYYHINWGWSGDCDGYFRLSALEPSEHGIGGSTTGDGYNFDQEAVIGIQPPTEGTVPYLPIYAGGGFTVISNKGGYIFAFGTSENPYGGMWSYSAADLTTMLGFKMVKVDTDEIVYHDLAEVSWPGDTGEGVSGYYSFSIDFSKFDFQEGLYKVYPVVCTETVSWQEIAVPYGTSGHVMMKVDTDGTINLYDGVPDTVAELSVTEFIQTSAPTSSADGAYSINVVNSSDAPYNGLIVAEIYESGNSQMLDSKSFNVALDPFEEKNVKFRWTPVVPIGNYEVVFYTQYGTPISEPFEYTMEEIKTSDLTVESCVYRTEPEVGMRTTYDVTIVNHSSIGYYSSVTMKAFDADSQEVIGVEKFYPVISGEGEFKSNFTWQATKEGEIVIRFYDVKDQLISGDFIFTIAPSSGVDEIIDKNETFDVFTIQGIKIAENVRIDDILKFRSGIFIVRDSSGIVRKIKI